MARLAADPLGERIAAHLQRLAGEIGCRTGGSAGNRVAAEYIGGVFAAHGLRVERQEFDCPDWQELATRLEMDGASLDAVANSFSPPCDVTAPAVAVGTIAELEAADLRGQVAVLHGDLVKDPLSAKSWFLKSEHDDRIIILLEEKAPAALITVQARPGELQRLIEDWEFRIHSATVPARVGLALLGRECPTVHLRVDSRQAPGRTGNVIGRRTGSGAGRVVLCAHYDTKFDTPGALDNGAGVATLLALAEQLAGAETNLGLEFIAFANEDTCLPTGAEVYVDRCGARFDDIVAVLNFDGVGHALDVNTVAIYSHSAAFRELVDGQMRGYPGLVWTDPWPESDHSAFSWRGVACLAFMSRAAWYLAHLRADTVEWVSPSRLAELARFVAAVVDRLQDRTPEWTRAAEG